MPLYLRSILICLGLFSLTACANQKTEKHTDQQVAVTTGSMPEVMLGVRMAPAGPAMAKHTGVDPDKATLVTFVAMETPAQRAGFENWDLIIAVNGSSNASPTVIRKVLRSSKPGDKVDFTICRADEKIEITAELVAADHDRMVPLPVRTTRPST
jgi:S1-C subfamily serine protease